jgi:alkyldihydroxyacetonephosphate synthase
MTEPDPRTPEDAPDSKPSEPGQFPPPPFFERIPTKKLPEPSELPLGSPRVELPEGFLKRLEHAGVECSVAPGQLNESSRDWWPITVSWAAQGKLPALAGVVARPKNASQVRAVAQACNDAGVPLTTAGGRSGVCGGSIPVFGGVLLDMREMAGIVSVDRTSGIVEVLAGTRGPDLEEELRNAHGLTVGHWPQSMELSSVGGWAACRGAGQYSTRYGTIADLVASMEVVLADGSSIHAGGPPRSSTGPDVLGAFIGSEGTLGIITSLELKARPLPAHEGRAAWSFPSFLEGLEACRDTLRSGATPAVLRLYDPSEARSIFGHTNGALLVALDEGEPGIVKATLEVLAKSASSRGGELAEEQYVEQWLEKRNDVSALRAAIDAGLVVDTVEISGRWSQLPEAYSRVIEALGSLPGTLGASAHQSHAYIDGACIYFTFAGFPPDPKDPSSGVKYYLDAWDKVMDATLRSGCAISHHHGIGLLRSRYLDRALGSARRVQFALKQALDPRGILNPGKLGFPSPFGPPPWPPMALGLPEVRK